MAGDGPEAGRACSLFRFAGTGICGFGYWGEQQGAVMENVQGVEVYMENRRFCLRAVLIGIGAAAMFAGLCGGCGYSREEKRRMEEIARLGE